MWIRYDFENKGITGKSVKGEVRLLEPLSYPRCFQDHLFSFYLCLILRRNWTSQQAWVNSGEPSESEVGHQWHQLYHLPPFLRMPWQTCSSQVNQETGIHKIQGKEGLTQEPCREPRVQTIQISVEEWRFPGRTSC